jgi:hypothetical protein
MAAISLRPLLHLLPSVWEIKVYLEEKCLVAGKLMVGVGPTYALPRAWLNIIIHNDSN